MPHALYAPRVNNNDDFVQVVELNVSEGDFVDHGRVVAAVETDKSVVEVAAEREGYVLKILPETDEKVAVGSVLLWLGDTVDEPVPETEAEKPRPSAADSTRRPTAKAHALLKKYGLQVSQIPCSGERLTVSDIEAYRALESRSGPVPAPSVEGRSEAPTPAVPGEFREPSQEARGMMMTVLWHRDQAAPAYLEMEYDPGPWESFATAYAEQHKLMLSPLLPLLAYRLVELAKDKPKVNATVVDQRHYLYTPINLGFTVQAGNTLYLTVVRDAQAMSSARFIDALGEVQRHAMSHKVRPEEVSGATLAFSSMARWNVSRHIPLLPPYTGLMIAHAAPKESYRAVLGASYDHRLLSGFDVAQVLRDLTQPPKDL